MYENTSMKGSIEIDDLIFESEEFTKCLSPSELVGMMKKHVKYNEIFTKVRNNYPNLIRLNN